MALQCTVSAQTAHPSPDTAVSWTETPRRRGAGPGTPPRAGRSVALATAPTGAVCLTKECNTKMWAVACACGAADATRSPARMARHPAASADCSGRLVAATMVRPAASLRAAVPRLLALGSSRLRGRRPAGQGPRLSELCLPPIYRGPPTVERHRVDDLILRGSNRRSHRSCGGGGRGWAVPEARNPRILCSVARVVGVAVRGAGLHRRAETGVAPRDSRDALKG